MSATTITTISTAAARATLQRRRRRPRLERPHRRIVQGRADPRLAPRAGRSLGEAVRRSTLAKDASIVVYCAGPACPASRQAAEKLAAFGYTRVEAYEGGLEEWKQAGFGIVGTGTTA